MASVPSRPHCPDVEASAPATLVGRNGRRIAGAAVANGRVYVMDYDHQKRQDALRCLSLADGKEIWRYAYPVPVKRNHGMSRTVPALHAGMVVAMGPKCHVVCLDAISGELKWGLDLAQEFGAAVPPWYAGQCPLIDNGRVILGVGGKDALMPRSIARVGKSWQTPIPAGRYPWVGRADGIRRTTHVCLLRESGSWACRPRTGTLESPTENQHHMIPSPVILEEGLVRRGNAGSLMLQLKQEGDRLVAQTAFKLEPEVFGATQQTPIYHAGHLFGVRPDGQLVCMDSTGKVRWGSGSGNTFGMGPFLIASGLIFAINDAGSLTLIEASSDKFSKLANARVLNGRESWGPLALAGGRLIARDFTRMVCLDVGSKP